MTTQCRGCGKPRPSPGRRFRCVCGGVITTALTPEQRASAHAAMHPDGACSCGGEGACTWCHEHCIFCGVRTPNLGSPGDCGGHAPAPSPSSPLTSRVRELAEKATPGKWFVGESNKRGTEVMAQQAPSSDPLRQYINTLQPGWTLAHVGDQGGDHAADATFIAAMREDAPRMAALLDEAKALLEKSFCPVCLDDCDASCSGCQGSGKPPAVLAWLRKMEAP